MRPDIGEQLSGLARALRDTVAPAVDGDHPSDVLAAAAATLDGLAGGWVELPAFLAWDAAGTVALLASIGVETPAPPTDPLDIRALIAHQEDVRRLLADHVTDIPAADLVAHFRARVERFPIKVQRALPGRR